MLIFLKRDRCPVCQSKNFLKIYDAKYSSNKIFQFLQKYYKGKILKKDLGRNKFILNKCESCSLIFQGEILDIDGMNKLYEEFIQSDISLGKRENANYNFFNSLYMDTNKAMKLSLKTFKKRPREINALDFGMGWGHWSIAAKACGFNIYGAELSESRKSFAEKNGINVIDPFKKDFDNFFHFINTDQVFEHLEDPDLILKNLVTNLKTKGFIKIFVPNTTRSYLRLKLNKKNWVPQHDAFHPLEHINSFNFKSICKLAKRNGLLPIKPSELDSNVFNIMKSKVKMFINMPSWYFQKI